MTIKHWKLLSICFILVLLSASPLQMAFGQDATTAQGGIFDDYQVQPDGRVEIPVEIRDVSDLYAVDIQIEFDPSVVQVEDADPAQDGIQPALGTFLDAGLTLFNEVDNEAGLVRFVMTQVNPSEAKSGSGVFLVLYLRGIQIGESGLDVTILELSTRAGEAIAVEPVSGSVTVSAEAAKTEATSIPVADSSLLVAVPTVIVTATPTPTESVAGDQGNTDVLGTENQTTEEAAASSESNNTTRQPSSGGGFSLVEHWWIVLVAVIVVIGFGVFLWVTKK
ncbi:MAG: hypothetical protein H0S79_16640 [Anaerolineaceae bacterium]|nr:hypothetical protein [Anaerolineaceae bacterium]